MIAVLHAPLRQTYSQENAVIVYSPSWFCSSFVKHKHECFAEGPRPGFHASRNSLLGGWLKKKIL